jgi:hypothetical protein
VLFGKPGETAPRLAETIYLNEADVGANYTLQTLDNIRVGSINEKDLTFFLEGAITPQTIGDDGSATTENKEIESSYRMPVTFQKGLTVKNYVRTNRAYFSNQNADLPAAYLERNKQRKPVNIHAMLYEDAGDDIILQNGDTLMVPFRQMFVSVSGAVAKPGRYPYIPNRHWQYYVGLAGGFTDRNSGDRVKIMDMENQPLPLNEFVPPESQIEAPANSFLHSFSRVAPVMTTTLSIITTFITTFLLIRSL